MKKSVLLLEDDYKEFQHIKQMLEHLRYEVLPKDVNKMYEALFYKEDFLDYVIHQIEKHQDDLALVMLSEFYHFSDGNYMKSYFANKIRDYEGIDQVYLALLPIVVIDHTPFINKDYLYEGVNYVYKAGYEKNSFSSIIDGLTINFEKSRERINNIINKSQTIKMKPKVFIVHGRSHLEEKVANVLECLKLEPIILREQANQGMTLIEKIEQYSDVAYAVVLYTPCDEGKLKDASIEELRPRARQNVVFEHGYLMSKLGRKKVCALVEEGVETPGDTSGIVYLPLDKENEWLNNLVKEFEASGIEIDHRWLRKAKIELDFLK